MLQGGDVVKLSATTVGQGIYASDSPDVSYGFPIHSVGRMEARYTYTSERKSGRLFVEMLLTVLMSLAFSYSQRWTNGRTLHVYVGEEEWKVVYRDAFGFLDVSYDFPIHSVGRMEAHYT